MVREDSEKPSRFLSALRSCLPIQRSTKSQTRDFKPKVTPDAESTQNTSSLYSHDSIHVPRAISADVKLTLAMFSKAINGIGQEILNLANEWEAGRFSKTYSYADYPTSGQEEWPTLPRHVVSLPKHEVLASSKIGRVFERTHAFMRAQMPFLARLDEPLEKMFADVGHDSFRAMFNSELFPMPSNIVTEEQNYWTNDDCFTDQFLNGCNPTVITRLKPNDVRTIPKALQGEKDPTGRTLEELAKAGHLYVADYEVLATPGIASGTDPVSGSFTNLIKFDSVSTAPHMTKYFYAPYVAFYQREDGHLGVLGIILTRHKDKHNFVYNSHTCKDTPNIYTFAKMHVSCADNQVHQFYYHLGRCHLVFEAFGVAVRNIFQYGDAVDDLAKNHIVGRLLAPHFRDHIATNWLARNTLVTRGEDAIPFTDASFAVGAQGGLKIIAMKYASWTLQDQALPARLRARGFDPEHRDALRYYYRDDGLRIWRALERYVEEGLKGYYKSQKTDAAAAATERNAKISSDVVLKRWCKEMRARDRAAVRSFPKAFTSLDTLRDTITTIIYNVSAEHAAVNASQERYIAYVPNRPNAIFKPVPPPGGKDMQLVGEILRIHRARGDDDDIGASMPLGFAMFQVQFSNLLTIPPEKTLLEIEGEGVVSSAVKRLRKDLTKAHYEIHARNLDIVEDTPHLPPYEFLDPALVSQSTDI